MKYVKYNNEKLRVMPMGKFLAEPHFLWKHEAADVPCEGGFFDVLVNQRTGDRVAVVYEDEN